MKKILTFVILTIAMLIATVASVWAAVNNKALPHPISIVLNGDYIEFSQQQQPFIENGRTLVPVRGVFEQAGFRVDWDENTSTVTLKNSNDTVIIPVGKTSFTANDKTITPDVPAQIINGHTMLPLRAICESLGSEVNWDIASQTAFIEYKKANNTSNQATEASAAPSAQAASAQTTLPLSATITNTVTGDSRTVTVVTDGRTKPFVSTNLIKDDMMISPRNMTVICTGGNTAITARIGNSRAVTIKANETVTITDDPNSVQQAMSNAYVLPATAPDYDYYEKAFSSTHEFRDIYLKQYGSDKKIIYDMVASVMIDMMYNDTIDYRENIEVVGFEKLGGSRAVQAAEVAVCRDMPILGQFVEMQITGNEKNFMCLVSRNILNYELSYSGKVRNYYSHEPPNDNKSYIATRENVINELNKYRAAVVGLTDDEEKLEIAGRLFDGGSVYDLNASYHGISALLTKRGICGSSNSAFAMVGNAIGVPTFWLSVSNMSHAVTVVKPNGGELKIFDVTFGKTNPKVESVSKWKNGNKMDWGDAYLFGFLNSHYFPEVDIINELGGLE